MANLLSKTRRITSILQRSVESLQSDLPYNTIADQLAEIIDCNACIIDGSGIILGYAMKYKTNTDRVEEFFQAKKRLLLPSMAAVCVLVLLLSGVMIKNSMMTI